MIIYNAHANLFHTGTSTTLTVIRQIFWILKARQHFKSFLSTCTSCKRRSGRPYSTPDPPPLPKLGMHYTVPFRVVMGIDFIGALYVQMNSAESKGHICLFTCTTKRAVHCEIVTYLTAETFPLSLRRISSCKLLHQIIASDNTVVLLTSWWWGN